MWLLKWLLGAVFLVQVAAAGKLSPELLDLSRDLSEKVKGRGRRTPGKKVSEESLGPREPKYFQEPGQAKAGHYDKRYFDGFLSDDERKIGLSHLIRSWLQWSQKEGVETWLAHGTLLGWWWNEKILPWDTDLDVQISEATLKNLAENLNMTTWSYSFESDGFRREYLLDVNPYWINRLRGTSSNLIDARWVDTQSGMFIDITGLSETHPTTRPNIISCKNFHRYHIDDIYPLREVTFEEFKAFIPNNFDKALTKEYRSKALVVTEFEGHIWQPAAKEWIELADNSTIKKRIIRLKNGKMISVKKLDPKGLDAVPEPSLLQDLRRLIWYW